MRLQRALWVGMGTALCLSALWIPAQSVLAQPVYEELFSEVERLTTPPVYLDVEPWRPVRVAVEVLRSSFETGSPVFLELLDGSSLIVESWRTIDNPSGSVSWIGTVRGDEHGVVVLVTLPWQNWNPVNS